MGMTRELAAALYREWIGREFDDLLPHEHGEAVSDLLAALETARTATELLDALRDLDWEIPHEEIVTIKYFPDDLAWAEKLIDEAGRHEQA